MSGIERFLVELSDEQLDTLASGGVVSVAGDAREIVVGGPESGVREAARETADRVVDPERRSTAAATVRESWKWSPADAPVDETRPGTVSVSTEIDANRVRLRVRPEGRPHESVGDDATAFLTPTAARRLAEVIDPQTDVSRASVWTEPSNTQARVVVDESQSGGLVVSVESDPSGHVVVPDDGGETAPRGSLREALVDAAEELIDP